MVLYLPQWTWNSCLVAALLPASGAAMWNKRRNGSWNSPNRRRRLRPRPERREIRTEEERTKHRRTVLGFTSMGVAGTFGLYLSLNTSLRFWQKSIHLQDCMVCTGGTRPGNDRRWLGHLVVGLQRCRRCPRVGYAFVLAQAIGAWAATCLRSPRLHRWRVLATARRPDHPCLRAPQSGPSWRRGWGRSTTKAAWSPRSSRTRRTAWKCAWGSVVAASTRRPSPCRTRPTSTPP